MIRVIPLLLFFVIGITIHCQTKIVSEPFSDEKFKNSKDIKWAFHDQENFAFITQDAKENVSKFFVNKMKIELPSGSHLNTLLPLSFKKGASNSIGYIIGGSNRVNGTKTIEGKLLLYGEEIDGDKFLDYSFNSDSKVSEILSLHKSSEVGGPSYACIYTSNSNILHLGFFSLPQTETEQIKMQFSTALTMNLGTTGIQLYAAKNNHWWVVGNGKVMLYNRRNSVPTLDISDRLTSLKACTVDQESGDLILTGQTFRIRYGDVWVGRLQCCGNNDLKLDSVVFGSPWKDFPVGIGYVSPNRFALFTQSFSPQGLDPKITLQFLDQTLKPFSDWGTAKASDPDLFNGLFFGTAKQKDKLIFPVGVSSLEAKPGLFTVTVDKNIELEGKWYYTVEGLRYDTITLKRLLVKVNPDNTVVFNPREILPIGGFIRIGKNEIPIGNDREAIKLPMSGAELYIEVLDNTHKLMTRYLLLNRFEAVKVTTDSSPYVSLLRKIERTNPTLFCGDSLTLGSSSTKDSCWVHVLKDTLNLDFYKVRWYHSEKIIDSLVFERRCVEEWYYTVEGVDSAMGSSGTSYGDKDCQKKFEGNLIPLNSQSQFAELVPSKDYNIPKPFTIKINGSLICRINTNYEIIKIPLGKLNEESRTKILIYNIENQCLGYFNSILFESTKGQQTSVFPQNYPTNYGPDSTVLFCGDSLNICHPITKDACFQYPMSNPNKYKTYKVTWYQNASPKQWLRFEKECKDVTVATKPRLFVLCIGMQYEKNHSQTYSSVDAKRLYDLFSYYREVLKGTHNPHFEQVHIELINDTSRTYYTKNLREAIEGVAESWNSKIRPDTDYVIVFLSGHGAEDLDKFYILVEKADRTSIYPGLEIQSFFSILFYKINSKRFSFFIESCRAGASIKYLNNIMNDEKFIARKFSEVNLLVSSPKNENSFGDDAIKSGYFSNALIKSLQSKQELEFNSIKNLIADYPDYKNKLSPVPKRYGDNEDYQIIKLDADAYKKFKEACKVLVDNPKN